MKAYLIIECKTKDNNLHTINFSFDFSDDNERGEFVVIALRLMKGGYVSLIETSKQIAKFSEGKIIINPIHINTVETYCLFDNEKYTLSKMLKIAGECDMRKFNKIDWVKIRKSI
jgi:hypothetical protein